MAITESRVLPPQFIEDLATDFGKQLTAQTAVPIDTSKFAPSVAAQDPLQTQAATLASSGIGSFQPFITAAQQQATAAGTQLGSVGTGIAGAETLLGAPTTQQITDFMSPYQSQVIDATLTEFDRNRAIQEQSIKDQQARLGVLGAGRAGVQLAEFGTGADRERALLQAGLLQQGFQQAQSARQQDFANRLGAAQARSGLAQQQLGTGQFQTGLASLVPQLQRADISQLGTVGGAQQAFAQAQIDAANQAAREAAFEPLQRAGFFGTGVTGLMGGYPGQFQFTSQPSPSPLQTALGAGATFARPGRIDS
mgnify:CR=1 FL=1